MRPYHKQRPGGAEGRWQLAEKHFYNQRGARLTALDYHKPSRIMVVGFSSGIFDIYQVSPCVDGAPCKRKLFHVRVPVMHAHVMHSGWPHESS